MECAYCYGLVDTVHFYNHLLDEHGWQLNNPSNSATTAKTAKVSPRYAGHARIEVSSFENDQDLSVMEPSLSSISSLKDNGKVFDTAKIGSANSSQVVFISNTQSKLTTPRDGKTTPRDGKTKTILMTKASVPKLDLCQLKTDVKEVKVSQRYNELQELLNQLRSYETISSKSRQPENNFSNPESSIQIRTGKSSRCKKRNKENDTVVSEFNAAVRDTVILPPELKVLKEASNESPLIRGRDTEGPQKPTELITSRDNSPKRFLSYFDQIEK